MKKLLLLSLLSLMSARTIGMQSPYAFTPKDKRINPEAEQYLLDSYTLAQAEAQMQPIITHEFYKEKPDKWSARKQFRNLLNAYYRELSQNDVNRLMNAFSERWNLENARSAAQKSSLS